MRTAEIERSPTLLIGDVEPNAFDPSGATQSVHVGILIDVSGLRVVPVISAITASTANQRDTLVRHAIIKASHTLPAFGGIRRFALIEQGRDGHILTPLGADGHPGRSRKVIWLGEVMLTFLKATEVYPDRLGRARRG